MPQQMSKERSLPFTLVNPSTMFYTLSGAPQALIASGERFITINGQVSRDVDGRLVNGSDQVSQATQTWLNVKHALVAAGATGRDVVQFRISVVGYRREQVEHIFAAGRTVFGADWMEQSTGMVVGVVGLGRPDLLIEIEAIAITHGTASAVERNHMPIERINPATLASAPGSHAQVIVAGIQPGTRFVFINAQVSRDVGGDIAHLGDHQAQARQAFENFKNALGAAGARGTDVVQYRLLVVDYRQELIASITAAGLDVFGDEFPIATSIVVGVAALRHPDYLIAIEGIAVLG